VPIAADYPFIDILGTMILFFLWIIWIWTVFVVLGDVFRRHDISGWLKALWTVVIIVMPFLGVLIYLISQGKSMAERNVKAAQAQQAAFDQYVKEAAGTGGPASEIANAKQLLESGTISQAEFDQIKARALGAQSA
jgi:Phospholipase_D-nuclease N-terminal